MNIQPEIHDNLAAQPEKLQELLETPRLCLVLNPKLPEKKRHLIGREHYVITVEHERKPHAAVIRGFYKYPYKTEVIEHLNEQWDALAEDAPPVEMYLALLETPHPCIVLNPKLPKPQLHDFHKLYYTMQVDHKGQPHPAILCAYYHIPKGIAVPASIREPWGKLAVIKEEN